MQVEPLSSPGGWGHLARRFLWSLSARPLTADELETVRSMLDGALLQAFLDQPPADQRHGLESAAWVTAHGGRPPLVTAALLHDIGKRHARLGVIGRSLASALAKLHFPTPGRLGRYLAHGRLGAEELESLGSDPLVVAFTRWHHGPRPASIPTDDWAMLVASDTEVVGGGGRGG